MPRLLLNNPLATITSALLVAGATILLCAAETFRLFNATGHIIFPATTAILCFGGGLILGTFFILLCDFNRRLIITEAARSGASAKTIVEQTALPKTISISLIIGFCALAIVSLVFFWANGPTAFQWPGTDMGPFFERYTDPGFASTDFFTNTSSLPNPRHIFGFFVIGTGALFDLDWYSTYYILKVVLVLVLPGLFFTSIALALRKRLRSDVRFFLALLITLGGTLAVFIDRINGFFSIGWWTPIDFVVRPQTISLLFGLTFVSLALLNHRRLSIPFLTFAALIHPSIGLFILAFYILLDFDFTSLRHYLLVGFFGVVVPFIAIIILFPTQTSFSGKEFVYHYITENHAFHYLPSQLASYTSFPWFISFGFILFLFGISTLAGFLYRDSYLKFISIACLGAYGGCVALQYLFVELYPIKALAAIGPIRFSLLAFWLLLFLYSYLIARYAPQEILPWVREIISRNTYLVLTGIAATILAICFIVGLNTKDSPVTDFTNKHEGLVSWIKQNTNHDDVFAVPPSFPPTHMPLVLRRAVFIGNGFPFTEDGFVEHNERKALIYGLEEVKKNRYPDTPLLEQTPRFYRELTPHDLTLAANKYRLDYVIIETAYADTFSSYHPRYGDDHYQLYSVKDLYETNRPF